MSDTPTSERILDAAEELFADNGINATSMRAIVARAKVNLASVNYHFGSKEGLIREVFSRRIGEVNKQRMANLNQLRSLHRDAPLPLEDLLRAFLEPALAFSTHLAEKNSSFLRLVARAHAETDPIVQEELVSQLHDVIEAFLAELQQSKPELSPRELRMRFSFTAGAMIHTILLPLKSSFAKLLSPASAASSSAFTSADALVAYAAAGFNAEPRDS